MSTGADATAPAAAPIRGIIGACLTPFRDDDRVDEDAFAEQVEFMVPHCSAIAVGAVEAAEYTVLRPGDRRSLLKLGVACVAGRVPVIVGASAPAVRDVLSLADWAAECGADLVQVLMPSRPWGGEPSTKELVAYFAQISTASPLPVVAYHNPLAGADPEIRTWLELADLPRIVYFKESSRDTTKIARLIEEIEISGRAGYFTTMQPLLMSLVLGGSGATMPPPATVIGANVVSALATGDLAAARLWQRVFAVFPSTWSDYGLVPVMKAAMRHLGVDQGKPAEPYSPLDRQSDIALRNFLAAVGVAEGQVAASDLVTAVAQLRRT